MIGNGKVLAFLATDGVDVVVVHQARIDLAVADGLHNGNVAVAEVDGSIGDHRFEPGPDRVIAIDQAKRRDKCLERRIFRRPANPAGPCGISQIPHRGGQIFLGKDLGVVSQHSRPAGHADPAALRITEALFDAIEELGGKSREAPFIGEQPEGARVLGEKETGSGIVALFQDCRRQFAGAAIAGIDSDSRFFGVLFHERPDEGLVPPGIEREIAGARAIVAPLAPLPDPRPGRFRNSGPLPPRPPVSRIGRP